MQSFCLSHRPSICVALSRLERSKFQIRVQPEYNAKISKELDSLNKFFILFYRTK